MSAIRVETIRELSALAPLRTEIDALNLASRRPSPFATVEYIETFLAHDEYATGREELLFLAAFDGPRLVGYLPLRKRRERVLGIPWGRVDLLVWHDTDRPHVVAAVADEPRCCVAFYRHLLERDRGWSLLELGMQDAESGLQELPPVSRLRFHARRFPDMPNTTLPLQSHSFSEYWQGIAGGQRRNVARLCRRLLAAGRVEVIACSHPDARAGLLDLYLDLERRSWKEVAHAGIRRHPQRIELFGALCAATQPLEIGFDLVLLDDLPVAGMVSGSFGGNLYGLEMAFDEDHEDLGPGHLLSLMAIRRAMAEGYRELNFGGNYAHYKARMGGVVTHTTAVQIYRVGSVPWLKARAGEVKRRLRPESAGPGDLNPERRRVTGPSETTTEEPGPRPPRLAEREAARAELASIEARGARLERLSGAALEHALPFSTRREATTTRAQVGP